MLGNATMYDADVGVQHEGFVEGQCTLDDDLFWPVTALPSSLDGLWPDTVAAAAAAAPLDGAQSGDDALSSDTSAKQAELIDLALLVAQAQQQLRLAEQAARNVKAIDTVHSMRHVPADEASAVNNDDDDDDKGLEQSPEMHVLKNDDDEVDDDDDDDDDVGLNRRHATKTNGAPVDDYFHAKQFTTAATTMASPAVVTSVPLQRLRAMLRNLSNVIDRSCVRTRVGFEYECVRGHRFFIPLEARRHARHQSTQHPAPHANSSNAGLTFDDEAWSDGWAVLRACASTSSMRPRPLLTECACERGNYARLQRIYVATAASGPACVARPKVILCSESFLFIYSFIPFFY